MSDVTDLNGGCRVTFRELFREHALVEVPIIQRDYVQGTASDVRSEFLNSLHAALSKPVGDPSLPLDLDFVYGTMEVGNRQVFCPLDGQQRLTTLFLLHWYLAWKDGRTGEFAAFVKNDRHSRFAYKVRPSSGEFFDALTNWTPDVPPRDAVSLKDIIVDQSWFFRSWRRDPTIESALSMLDALNAKFAHADGFYDRLTETEQPYITFQLLDLHNFGLSDDLYIKMNARGKPLTAFETFKAKLEKHINELFPNEKRDLNGKPTSTRDYFSHRIDTAWADLFWQFREPNTNLFDNKLMNLVRAIATVTRDPNKSGVDLVLYDLRSSVVSYTILRYQGQHCLDRRLLETLLTLLDRWCGESNGIKTYLPDATYFDERRVFEKVITDCTSLTYTELVQFHAYTSYLVKQGPCSPAEPFAEWMRIIRNLTVNSDYDNLDDFKRSLRSVNELINESDHILAYLATPSAAVSGFNEQQIGEEILKAYLIQRSLDWRSLILDAEQHGYFNGQVQFLFEFSKVLDNWVDHEEPDWTALEDAEYRQAFANYFVKASAIFSANGLDDFGEHRWERALLSIGPYLLPKNSNLSFLTDFDRDASWKRLLRGGVNYDDHVNTKRQYVKDLLDRIDLSIGVKESLDVVIDRANPDVEWRRAMVANPRLIDYCARRMVRWGPIDTTFRIYLLRKLRMSGEHAELFTYDLATGLLADKHERGELAPFGAPTYWYVNTDSEEPYVAILGRTDFGLVAVKIFGDHQEFAIRLVNHGSEMPDEFVADLTANGPFQSEVDGSLKCSVERAKIHDVIDTIVAVCKTWTTTFAH